MGTRERVKVAILGGGLGALSAAYRLTKEPDFRDRYDVTVYQVGWRLGGKGASGRNADAFYRSEEHGLHVFLGWYHNVFKMLRECYAELGRPISDAFVRHSNVTVADRVANAWKFWSTEFPEDQDPTVMPGMKPPPTSPWRFIRLLARFMKENLSDLVGQQSYESTATVEHPRPPGVLVKQLKVGPQDAETARPLLVEALPFLEETTALAEGSAESTAPESEDDLIARMDELNELFAEAVTLEGWDDVGRRLLVMLNIGASTVKGLLVDRVHRHGFERIDSIELSEWLRKHGTSTEAIDSGIVRGGYDLVFAYPGGALENRQVAAGTALRGLLRMLFAYEGAIFWKMRAGMGETVFAPLFQVLRQRGVRFKFFHRVTELVPDGANIGRIRMIRQATVKTRKVSSLSDEYGYHPLFRVKGWMCWPSVPHLDQIVEDERLQSVDLESHWCTQKVEELELKADRHFDVVILGISIGALKEICAKLAAARPAWQMMLDKVQTVKTLALQLWLSKSATELGWTGKSTIMDAFANRFNTWGDLSHLPAVEGWPADLTPANNSYFCGVLDDIGGDADPEFPQREHVRVMEEARRWLNQHVGALWPDAVGGRAAAAAARGFNWELLCSPGKSLAPADPLASQYWCANVNPSDRYVLSLPGTTQYRLRADQSSYENLFLAGDWVKTGIDAGCAEAACVAGLQAGRAICGHTNTTEPIVGETDTV